MCVAFDPPPQEEAEAEDDGAEATEAAPEPPPPPAPAPDVPAVAAAKAAATLIVPSPHGNNAGIIGALTLAQDALDGGSSSPCRLSMGGGAFAAGALLAVLLR